MNDEEKELYEFIVVYIQIVAIVLVCLSVLELII